MLQLAQVTFEAVNVPGRFSSVGAVERVTGNCGVTLGIVVEVLVIDQLLLSETLGLDQGVDLVVDLEELALDSPHGRGSLRLDQPNMGEAPGWRNGRRDGLKIRWAKARGGSSPPPGTNKQGHSGADNSSDIRPLPKCIQGSPKGTPVKIEHLGPSTRADFVGPVSLRCPSCRQNGTFEPAHPEVKDLNDLDRSRSYLQRRCPNEKCNAHVFVVIGADRKILSAYPPEVIDFDSTAIPDHIVDTFEEALRCKSIRAHRAAAIMIRRTLEELCAERQAEGETLKDRIDALASLVTLPQSLLDGADVLRLLGDDAAYVEAKDFDQITDDELDVAILFTKELLKTTYQYADLLSKLQGLKSGPT